MLDGEEEHGVWGNDGLFTVVDRHNETQEKKKQVVQGLGCMHRRTKRC